ncbi:MAG: HAMP domain-containing sensor histidine kinase, partial [Candidatus Nitrosopolaris sp.]
SYVAIFEKLWQQTELYQKVKETNEQLAKANEELKQAGRIKDDFINVAAHELRNPIQPILGLAQILRSRKMRSDASHNNSLTIDEDHKLLDIIVRNAKKLLLLEENILDVARIENKSLKLDIEECDLYDVIASIVQETRDQIDNSRVELLYKKGEDGILMVLVDKSRLEQVLSNLLSNSIKFTKEGTISLNVEKKDNQALVTVKDTGPGIDTEMLPRLFSKFATKSERGAGLGLFICKNIIEAHGGRIWAENNSDGKGAKFSFSLAAKN